MTTIVIVSHQARQYKITCTPGKILNEVLTEACSRAELDPDTHGLRHGKTTLDLSLPFRLARLSNGAKLDLVKVGTSSTVNVALSEVGCARRTVTVPATDSIWRVLETFDVLERVSLRDGTAYRDQCVVQLNNKEYADETSLRGTTLASLGIKSGSAVMRLSYRTTDQVTSERPKTTVVPEAPAVQEAVLDAPMPDIEPPVSSTMSTKSRPVEVLIPSTNAPYFANAERLSDDEKMSIDQARAYQASLNARAQSSQGPLLTQKHRDQRQADRRMKSKPETCRVKFRFSDGTQVISSFAPSESVSELYAFARTLISDPASPFSLETLGDKMKLSPTSTGELWKDWSFGSGVALQVIPTSDKAIEVKEEYRAIGKDISSVLAASDDRPAQPRQPQKLDQTPSQPKEKKIPKWLQKSLGKK